jgi:hypothetical protein
MSVADPEYKIHLSGSGSFTQNGPDGGALKWSFDVTAVYVGDGLSMNIAFGYDGDLQGSSSHIAGSVLSSIRATANAGGRTAQAGMDESLSLDLSLDGTCSTYITDGALEAKRVWTARPSDDDLWRDVAAKITWTGCGQATIQWSTS